MTLYAIDSTLYRWINRDAANPVLDVVMPFITEPHNPWLYVPLIVLAAVALWRFRARAAWCIGVIVLAVTAGDQLSSSVVKKLVARERPCRALDDVRLLRPCGGGKSFPSSHAVNITAAAVVVALSFRRALPYAFSLALLICLSRVYVGVHYPSDVAGGALLGSALAWLIVAAVGWARARWRGRASAVPG